jgi:RecB family exonuclease
MLRLAPAALDAADEERPFPMRPLPRSVFFDEVATAAAEGERTTIVCRSAATVREVYRRLASGPLAGPKSGLAGVEVSTLKALCAAASPRALGRQVPRAADDALPNGHPWRPLLEGRPGLRRRLRAHAERLHGVALVRPDLRSRPRALSPELAALLEAGWGAPEHLEGARRILAGPLRAGRALAVGFAPGRFSFLGNVGPLERALLAALGARPAAAGDPDAARPGPIPALRVPDPIAEARAVALEAAGAVARGGSVLVLAPDEPSEQRIRAALQRNGVPVADDAARSLERHSLAARAAPLLPLFASRGRAPVEAATLVRLFTDPVSSRRPPAQGIAPIAGVDQPRASVRHVRDLLSACRRIRAPLSEWLEALASLEAGAGRRLVERSADASREPEGDLPGAFPAALASARILLAQVRALDARARGGGCLGDLALFLEDLGLADPAADPLGQAVIRALEQSGHQPADAESFAGALAGSSSSGRVDDGARVLSYAAYDGRDCDLLLLTGVHDQGLAAAPGPDALLTDADREALGLPGPRQVIEERLALARWAASQAERVLAVAAQTDASGRRVAAPEGLDLAYDPARQVAPYGLDLPLPEIADLESFGPESSGGKARPAGGDFAQQIDAEWARDGAAFQGGPEPAPRAESPAPPETLLGPIARAERRWPADLRPYLGEASAGPPAAFALSATRLEAFTTCLYRAFCQSVLQLKPLEELDEDLDGREVGTAVHSALEHSLEGACLAVPDPEIQEARREVLGRLQKEIGRALEAMAAQRPGGDRPPIAAARQGLVSRWQSHLTSYVEARIQPLASLQDRIVESLAGLQDEGALSALMALVGPGLLPTPARDLRRALLEAAAVAKGDAAAVAAAADRVAGALAAKHRPSVAAALRSPESRAALEALCARVEAVLGDAGFDPRGDLIVEALELAFGELGDGAPAPPLALRLGRGAFAVRGKIDLVVRRRGDGSVRGTAYRVVDFKTGGSARTEEEIKDTLLKPQLAFYALALQALAPLDPAHPPPFIIERGELDYVRQKKVVSAELGPAVLKRAQEVFGALLDRARAGSFPLAPHPQACPLLAKRGAFCDFSELCRLRPSADEPEPGGPA